MENITFTCQACHTDFDIPTSDIVNIETNFDPTTLELSFSVPIVADGVNCPNCGEYHKVDYNVI